MSPTHYLLSLRCTICVRIVWCGKISVPTPHLVFISKALFDFLLSTRILVAFPTCNPTLMDTLMHFKDAHLSQLLYSAWLSVNYCEILLNGQCYYVGVCKDCKQASKGFSFQNAFSPLCTSTSMLRWSQQYFKQIAFAASVCFICVSHQLRYHVKIEIKKRECNSNVEKTTRLFIILNAHTCVQWNYTIGPMFSPYFCSSMAPLPCALYSSIWPSHTYPSA